MCSQYTDAPAFDTSIGGGGGEGEVMLVKEYSFKRYATDKFITAVKALLALMAWASEDLMTND